MRLYANEAMLQWRGTQADAKAAFGTVNQIDVPTDKLGLLEFLNNYATVPEADKRVEQSVEETIIRARELKYQRENTSTVSAGTKTKQVVCYLEYDPSIDEVTNVRMVSTIQLAQDDFASWGKLDQQLTGEKEKKHDTN